MGYNLELYTLAAFGLLCLAYIMIFFLFKRLRFLSRHYQSFTQGKDGASLEGNLQEILGELGQLRAEVEKNRNHMREIMAVMDTAIRGLGVVRFNAFQDTGSDLSFSVAFLDAHKNGVVVSSIYGREETRTYAKPVENGKSFYQLSSEELDAIQSAINSMKVFTAH
jgi:hypothetical protein